jgi:hypothetical protein
MGIEGRRPEKHLDAQELNALVQPSAEERRGCEAVREAGLHVESCASCRRRVAGYRQLLDQLLSIVTAAGISPRSDCPNEGDVEWDEVAAGLWPELKAKQLIMHAMLCDYCGPRLREATSISDDPSPQEEALLAILKAPSRPVPKARQEPISPSTSSWGLFPNWKIIAAALALMIVLVGIIITRLPSSGPPLSGPMFAEFAVRAHQHSVGSALEIRSDSQQVLNEWFKAKVPFFLALPASPAAPFENRPYRLEGAELVPVDSRTAVYIAYQAQTGPVGLIVAPDSLAVASGGVEAAFKKVTFHYRMVEGYKVVTWSLNRNTYALVSREGNSTQQSCMVCHSAMRDRDLGQTATPLQVEPLFQ